jgi:branched-chain amino acid transport system permease protein
MVMLNLRVARFGKYSRIWPALWRTCLAAAMGLSGCAIAIEMLYHLSLNAANGTTMKLFGFMVDAATAVPWMIAASLAATGMLGFVRMRPKFSHAWSEVNAEIEQSMRGARA